MDKKINYISASRMDLLNQCSWQYWARYKLKVPSSGNDGSSKGSIVHLVLEFLFKDKHKKHYDYIKKNKTYKGDEALERLINYHARKLSIFEDSHLDMIDKFLQVAINNNFFGPKSTVERYGEKEFKLTIKEKDKNYNVMGYIDQTFICKEKDGVLYAKCVDFKSSKRIFEKDKIDYNIQSIIYQLAIKYLYPNIKKRSLEFIFLAFPESPIIEQPQVLDEVLEGFECYLTSVQELIDNFDEKAAWSSFAADKGYPAKDAGFSGLLVCGKARYAGELKKDGNPMYYCEYKFPLDYYVTLNKEGEIINSAFNEKDLKIEKEQKIEKRKYLGCAKFNGNNYKNPNLNHK